ncbi:hypothetical protein PFTANZ_00836 [Plasmodium falciparum Tanzania (2000708)]|uniref:Uncharacterized protein n=1 Tax=Plasmodium falciparum Tanzania (2000708) TaxID=1036725 RepID=A0A024WE47_PLAFA|nr:hypothetical protein PFTANZ_00836 [Plasmodium falciparum Tanzania (2000708)]
MKNMNDENGSTIEGDPNTEKAKNKNNNNNDDINENIIDDEKKKKEQQQDDEEDEEDDEDDDEEDDEDDDEEDDEDDDEEDDADNDLCDQNVLIIGDENLSFSNYIIEAYASSNIYIASTLTEFQVNLLLKDLEKKKVNKCLHEKREIDDVSTNYGPFDFTRKFKERHVSKNVHIIFNVNLFNLKSYFPKNFFKAVFLILPGKKIKTKHIDDNPEEETEKYSQDEENNIRDIFEDSYNKDNEINELLDDVNTSTFEDIEIIKYIYTNDDLKNKKSGLINIIRFPLLYEINLKKLMKIFCFYEHIKKEEKINTIFHIEDIINSYYPLVYGHHFMYNEFLKNCKFFSFVLKKKKKITIPEELVVLIPHIEYNYKIDSYHFLKKLYYSVFNEPRICYTSINEQIKHINQMRYKLYVHNLKTSKHFKNEKISSIHNNMISSYYIYQNHINNMIKNKTTCCINDDLWKTVLNPFDFFHLNNDVNVFFEYNILTNIYNKFVTTVNTDFNKLCVNFYIKKDYKQYEEDNTNEHNSKRIMKRKFNKNGLYNTIGDNKNKPPLLPTPKNESYKLVNSINNNHRHNINNMNNQRNGNRHKNNTNNNTLLYKHATNNIQNNFNKSYRNENNIRNSMHNNNYDNNTKREDKNQKYVKNENQREGTSRKNNASSVYRNYNVSNGNEHTNFNNNVSASHANFSYKPMRNNNNNNNNNMRGDNNSMRGGYM